jgi:uncharacterized membrane protein YuzA (DUF378 family)
MRYTTIIIGVAALVSCTSVHKTMNKRSESVDSTSVSKTEQAAVSKHDSTINNESSNAYTRETVIEYGALSGNSFYRGDSNFRSNMPTVGDLIWNGDKGMIYDSGPNMRLSKEERERFARLIDQYVRPSKIIIRETGTQQTRQTGNYLNIDSSGQKKFDSVAAKSELVTVSTTKDKTGLPFMPVIYVLVGLGVLAFVGYVVRKFTV